MNARNLTAALLAFAAAGASAQTTPAPGPAQQVSAERIDAGAKELVPEKEVDRDRVPSRPSGLTREQVRAEFYRARAHGEIAVTEADNDIGSAVSRARAGR